MLENFSCVPDNWCVYVYIGLASLLIAISFCCDLSGVYIFIYVYIWVFGSSWNRQECDDGPSGSGECSCMAGQEAWGVCKLTVSAPFWCFFVHVLTV